ncbi:unnamed protein product, partial [Polarella glacialis]
APPRVQHPWVEVESDDGLYFFNEVTGKFRWDPPLLGREWDDAGEDDALAAADDADAVVEFQGLEEEVFGARPELSFSEVSAEGGGSEASGVLLKAVVPMSSTLQVLQTGVQAVLSCAPGVLFRIQIQGQAVVESVADPGTV